MKQEHQECANCRFWDCYQEPAQTDEAVDEAMPYTGAGSCRRFPPFRLTERRDRLWLGCDVEFYDNPQTAGHDWCGEWKRAPKTRHVAQSQ